MPNQRRTTVRRAPVQPRRRSTSRSQSWFSILALLTVVALLIGAVGSAVFLDLFRDGGDDVIDVGDFNPDEEDETEQGFREDYAARPDDPETIAILANHLSLTGKSDEAISLFERALEIAPDDLSIRYNFAEALADAGSNRDVELQLTRVIDTGSSSVYVGLSMLDLARLYRDWSPPRLEEAIAMYQRAAALQGDTGVRDTAVQELTELGVGTPVASPPAPGAATPRP